MADLEPKADVRAGSNLPASNGASAPQLNVALLTLEAAHELHKDSPRACVVYGDFRQRVHDLRRLSALLDANRELRTFCPDVLDLADELVRIGALAIAKAAEADRSPSDG
ncbi:MAG TPA: hypothetical protein VHM19_23120 [Polyangiales bacterium]|jgi:hypothetical protein|nr:hypothetical protein [Polyangiales bacterium]